MGLAATQKCIFKVTDNDGTVGSFALDVPMAAGTDPLGGLTGLPAVFNAVSDAIITGQIGQTADNSLEGIALTNPYDIRDKLEIGYVDSQNGHHVIMVPDLDPAILQANKEYVDPANVEWQAAKTAIEGNVKDKAGNSVTVTYGKRTRSRNLTRKVLPETA